jgi:hypothetical protein
MTIWSAFTAPTFSGVEEHPSPTKLHSKLTSNAERHL